MSDVTYSRLVRLKKGTPDGRSYGKCRFYLRKADCEQHKRCSLGKSLKSVVRWPIDVPVIPLGAFPLWLQSAKSARDQE
jgi:hypothetical protein